MSTVPSQEPSAEGAHEADATAATRGAAGKADQRGRPWYHPRPDPARRRDALGFNFFWWVIVVVVILGLLEPWSW
jgi:hypothetical protein